MGSESESTEQVSLEGFAIERTDETFTKVVKLRLRSSSRKNRYLREHIKIYQRALSIYGDRLVSFKPHQWGYRSTAADKIRKEHFPKDERLLSAQSLQEAFDEVSSKLATWRDAGRPGKRPFEDHDRGGWLRLKNQGYTIERNNGSYGIKLNIKPYAPEWFGIDTRDPYAVDHLDRIIAGELQAGGCAVRLEKGSKTPRIDLPVSEVIPVYSTADLGDMNTVGVDLGENTLYAVASRSPSADIHGVTLESGREFRHHRERLTDKKDKLAERGDLRGVRQCKGERENYTDHVTHAASREIVEFAREQMPCAIAVEDLTGYRETADDPIHDWPQHLIREKIAYKALEAGIPVVTVDPRNTSVTCRKCEQTDPAARNGPEFSCRRCGYEVHADVNAAINIAERATSEG
jgi:IS605 OrfB family transposase